MAEPTSVVTESTVTAVDPGRILANEHNPRRFFNEQSLDELRSSIQHVGILVPLIVYENPESPGWFVLLDGERRLRCALELALDRVPVNTIPAPNQLDNILRMFNIHAVREEWPLIAISISLRDVIVYSGEDRESRLSELTGLPRATVRRAKKLLQLPIDELERIKAEAHLDRNRQIHREDLYIEVVDAVSAVERGFPEIAIETQRPTMIRRLVEKRETGSLVSVTDYRSFSKLVRSVEDEHVPRAAATRTVNRILNDASLNPKVAIDDLAQQAFGAKDVVRRSELLIASLADMESLGDQRDYVTPVLERLHAEISRLLR